MPLYSGTPSMGLEPMVGRHASSPVRPAWPARRGRVTGAALALVLSARSGLAAGSMASSCSLVAKRTKWS